MARNLLDTSEPRVSICYPRSRRSSSLQESLLHRKRSLASSLRVQHRRGGIQDSRKLCNECLTLRTANDKLPPVNLRRTFPHLRRSNRSSSVLNYISPSLVRIRRKSIGMILWDTCTSVFLFLFLLINKDRLIMSG